MPRMLIVYHFFHPDEVISARIFGDFAQEMRQSGWDVTVLTSNRSRRDPRIAFPRRERWDGVDIVRVHRPAWDQSRPLLRLANSSYLIAAWFLRSLTLGSFDAIVLGSDPAFAPLLLIPLKLVNRSAQVAHWCFDLYPEAIEAEMPGRAPGWMIGASKWLMKRAYRQCSYLVDLGPFMRERLRSYAASAVQETIVPWSLVEPVTVNPPDPAIRHSLFGNARLCLLYSGTLGRAHDFSLFLSLARLCRERMGNDIAFAFSSEGARVDELRAALREDDTNVVVCDPCPEAEMQKRLESADIHLISLRPNWSGCVVPSKFFGSLAVGRPVLYAGEPQSDISQWATRNNVGWTLTPEMLGDTVDRLVAFTADRRALATLQENAQRLYQSTFSKRESNQKWNKLLRVQRSERAGSGRGARLRQ